MPMDLRSLSQLVIGKSENPRCFKSFNHKLYVDYKANKKAWMNSVVFADWIKVFNARIKCQKRNVLLLLDNAPSHMITSGLTNVKVHFLPPNTTSHLQPLDAGIIQSFKANYRRFHLQHIIDLIDSDKSPALALSDAIRYVKRAWDNVTPTTILHCWQHTEIIPCDPISTTTTTVEAAPNTTDKVTPLLNIVIEKLQIEPGVRMSVTEFMDVDHNCETMNDLSDADIIKSVRTDEKSETEAEEDEDDIPEEPMPTAKEVRTGLKALKRLFEKSRHSNETDVNMFFDMQERANQLLLFGSHQTSITSFSFNCVWTKLLPSFN